MRKITEKIDNITLVDDKWRHAILPAPPSAKLELTAACNYKCKYCIKSIRPDSRTMDRAEFSRIIRELRDAGTVEIAPFYIGESFLCPWLHEAIAEMREVGFPYIFLTTNGSACSEKKLRAVMEAGLNSLKFSLNFSDEQQFTEIAQTDSRYFRKAIEMVKVARRVRDEGGYDCGIFASSIQYDGEQGERMQAVLDEVAPYLDEPPYFLPLFNMSGASLNAGMKPLPGNPGRVGCMRPPLPCWAVSKELHLTCDLRLSACCFGTGIDDDSLTMANLGEVSVMSGWNSVQFQELRKAHLRGDVTGTGCERCVAAT